MEELTPEQARRLFLTAQRFKGARTGNRSVTGVLRALGAVQLDTISVLARSHELVAYARLGPVGRRAVESAYWGKPSRTFEYWAHAACILPMETWPLFAFRRRHYRDFDAIRGGALAPTAAAVLDRLKVEGPLTIGDLGGGRKGGPWWDWSDAKVAVEMLLRAGEVVCVERRAFTRVYDLADRAIPHELRTDRLADEECWARLVAVSAARLGVATEAELADYFRLKRSQVAAGLEGSGIVPVTVRSWPERAWIDPGALEELNAGRARGRNRTTLLSPFDSLVWHRPRTERVFGFTHRLEAYVPRGKRIHGYFAMPLLAGGQLVGRADPGRSGKTLVARHLSVEPASVPAMAEALMEAASWVGCNSVAIEHVEPSNVKRPLRAELKRLGA